jgi:hypothetical protein
MTNPRYTDPRYSDPQLSNPVLRRDESPNGAWGWIAGLAVLALIAFVVIAGWNNSGTNTASNNAPPMTTGSTPMRNVMPPSTTGSGSLSPTAPSPATPAPSAPAKDQ